MYGWYGTRILFNSLDMGQEEPFKSLSYETVTFLPIFSLTTMLNLKYIILNISSHSRSIKKTLPILLMCLSLLSDSQFCTVKDTITVHHS